MKNKCCMTFPDFLEGPIGPAVGSDRLQYLCFRHGNFLKYRFNYPASSREALVSRPHLEQNVYEPRHLLAIKKIGPLGQKGPGASFLTAMY